MILKKLVLFLLIVFNEEILFGSQQTNLQEKPILNFVMATDKNYIIPTLVAMYSVIKNCKDCIKHFIIFVGSNKIRLLEKTEPLITAYVDRLVCLRVILPEFFQQNNSFYEGDLNEEHVKLSDYLWLDSDVLVVKDLKEMYATCKNQNQPIIGSNYLYIDCSLENPSEGNIFYSPDTQQHHPISMTDWRSDKAKYQGRFHPCFQISGGVVFFNLILQEKSATAS